MDKGPKAWFRTAFWTLILLLTGTLALGIQHAETQKTTLRQDLSTLQEVRYGLFNVDEWKVLISGILSTKIDDFNIEEGNRDEMEAQVQSLLRTLIKELEQNYHQDRSSSFIGLIESTASSVLGVFEQMERNVPEMANKIVRFIDDPENKEKIQAYLLATLDRNAAETFGSTDYRPVDELMDRRGIPAAIRSDRMATTALALQARLRQIEEVQFPLNIAGLVLLLTTGISLFFFAQTNLDVKLIVFILFVWLVLGIQMPMLIIQARIDRLEFQLLGEPILFTDQVLFYQSKSILDVVQLLLFQGKGGGTIAAGLGVFLFSLAIPMVKLLATALWRENQKWSGSFWGKLILFRSAKWAMADVMVVAIFLSYLGFNGVLRDQMQRLDGTSAEILTTANSTLLPGFMAFLGFAVLGLLLSERLKQLNGQYPAIQRTQSAPKR